MRAMASLLIFLVTLMNACAALAVEPQRQAGSAPDGQVAAHAEATADTAGDPDRMVCHVERTIGSNLAHKVCRSAAQLERERELSREGLSKAQQLH